jgi:hypothetical protein
MITSTHILPTNQMGDLWSNYPLKWNIPNLAHLVFLQNKDYIPLNIGWNEIQASEVNNATS